MINVHSCYFDADIFLMTYEQDVFVKFYAPGDLYAKNSFCGLCGQVKVKR